MSQLDPSNGKCFDIIPFVVSQLTPTLNIFKACERDRREASFSFMSVRFRLLLFINNFFLNISCLNSKEKKKCFSHSETPQRKETFLIKKTASRQNRVSLHYLFLINSPINCDLTSTLDIF